MVLEAPAAQGGKSRGTIGGGLPGVEMVSARDSKPTVLNDQALGSINIASIPSVEYKNLPWVFFDIVEKSIRPLPPSTATIKRGLHMGDARTHHGPL